MLRKFVGGGASGADPKQYFCAEAGFKACETAVMTHGGMGYSKEVRSALRTPLTQQYHVERCVARACRRLTWIGIYARALCVGR